MDIRKTQCFLIITWVVLTAFGIQAGSPMGTASYLAPQSKWYQTIKPPIAWQASIIRLALNNNQSKTKPEKVGSRILDFVSKNNFSNPELHRLSQTLLEILTHPTEEDSHTLKYTIPMALYALWNKMEDSASRETIFIALWDALPQTRNRYAFKIFRAMLKELHPHDVSAETRSRLETLYIRTTTDRIPPFHPVIMPSPIRRMIIEFFAKNPLLAELAEIQSEAIDFFVRSTPLQARLASPENPLPVLEPEEDESFQQTEQTEQADIPDEAEPNLVDSADEQAEAEPSEEEDPLTFVVDFMNLIEKEFMDNFNSLKSKLTPLDGKMISLSFIKRRREKLVIDLGLPSEETDQLKVAYSPLDNYRRTVLIFSPTRGYLMINYKFDSNLLILNSLNLNGHKTDEEEFNFTAGAYSHNGVRTDYPIEEALENERLDLSRLAHLSDYRGEALSQFYLPEDALKSAPMNSASLFFPLALGGIDVSAYLSKYISFFYSENILNILIAFGLFAAVVSFVSNDKNSFLKRVLYSGLAFGLVLALPVIFIILAFAVIIVLVTFFAYYTFKSFNLRENLVELPSNIVLRRSLSKKGDPSSSLDKLDQLIHSPQWKAKLKNSKQVLRKRWNHFYDSLKVNIKIYDDAFPSSDDIIHWHHISWSLFIQDFQQATSALDSTETEKINPSEAYYYFEEAARQLNTFIERLSDIESYVRKSTSSDRRQKEFVEKYGSHWESKVKVFHKQFAQRKEFDELLAMIHILKMVALLMAQSKDKEVIKTGLEDLRSAAKSFTPSKSKLLDKLHWESAVPKVISELGALLESRIAGQPLLESAI